MGRRAQPCRSICAAQRWACALRWPRACAYSLPRSRLWGSVATAAAASAAAADTDAHAACN
eukprot:351691-Chlamydomonas_euryale.AAC.7